jgi:hypothetical protein
LFYVSAIGERLIARATPQAGENRQVLIGEGCQRRGVATGGMAPTAFRTGLTEEDRTFGMKELV